MALHDSGVGAHDMIGILRAVRLPYAMSAARRAQRLSQRMLAYKL